MVLHMLFGQQQLRECLALINDEDTLLVMDGTVLEQTRESLQGLPCPVVLLEDGTQSNETYDGVTRINHCGWIELVSSHAHSMSWA